MKKHYNLTEQQKELAKELVRLVRDDKLTESFRADDAPGGLHLFACVTNVLLKAPGDKRQLLALEKAEMLLVAPSAPFSREQSTPPRRDWERIRSGPTYTLLGSIYEAVDSNFAEPETSGPLSTLAHATPPELNISLDRLRKRYPEQAKLGFLIMRFTESKPFDAIATAIKETASKLGINIVRADDQQFHDDLWGNVRTHLEGCSFGVAVYERIDQEEPNANVGLEIGYLLAMNKPVLLLKEKSVKTLQADLMGRLYKQFDEHDPAATIPGQLEAWLRDQGIVVATKPQES